MNIAPRQRRFEELPSPDPADVTALAPDHPAILQKLPLFEQTVVNANDSPRLFVSGENNRKIGRVVTKGAWKGMPIYTLTLPERMTCPTSCHMYFSCYGNAMPFARRHAPGLELEQRISKELVSLSIKHPRGLVVRLHILGDFYSATYAHLWADMLSVHEALHVYGYTALGESQDPDDLATLNVIESMNANFSERCFIRMSSAEPMAGGASVIDRLPDGPTVAEGLVCPAERDATACCATCGLCWEDAAREKNIVFLRHGKGSRGTERMAREATQTDASGVRRVEPLANLARLSGRPSNQAPTLLWLKPIDLFVDEGYQRSLSRSSIKLISRIVQGWNWTHFKPPIVVKDDVTDMFYVLDGQHTAIAAASHPSIEKIPVMVVDAEHISERARAFIGHNKDRISVSATQLHHSAIVAHDPEALEIEAVCKDAGVIVLRQMPQKGVFRTGETMALNSIRSLIRRFGSEKTRAVLTCLVRAERAPIRSDEMKSVAHLLYVNSGSVAAVDVVRAMRETPYAVALPEARDLASSAALPLAEALAAVYARHAGSVAGGTA